MAEMEIIHATHTDNDLLLLPFSKGIAETKRIAIRYA